MRQDLADYVADLDVDIVCARRDGLHEYAAKMERERKRILRQVRERRKYGDRVKLPTIDRTGRVRF